MVLILTWLVAGLVMGLYIWWFVVRYRRDQRKKLGEAERDAAATEAVFRSAKLAETAPAPPPEPFAARPPLPVAPLEPLEPDVAPLLSPSPAPVAGFSSRATTVAEALTGIVMPSGLAPLITISAVPTSGDRVAFWTNTARAEEVGPAFASEVERLGYSMTPIDDQTIALLRGENNLVVTIHPDGRAAVSGGEPLYPTVPEGAVVLDVRVVF